MDEGELDEKNENVLFKETVSRHFKMLSFIPFELLDLQSRFHLNETRPQSVQTAWK